MRLFVAGILLILSLPGVVLAQAKGQVLKVGFGDNYRPDCWTPMLVQLTNLGEASTEYQIRVVQEDLDRDRVSFTQMETVGGAVEGKPATTEVFWVYFRPKPTERGLPDSTDTSSNLKSLNNQLKVFLCDKDGKQLSTLPITSTITSVDSFRSAGDASRSRKLILFVSDSNDKPRIEDDGPMRGILEDVCPVPVRPSDLPSNVIGYEGVDAIVWMNADANYLTSGTRAPTLEALRQWIRQGGHLIVCQPPEALRVKPFADILPVAAIEQGEWTIPMADRQDDLDNLRRIVNSKRRGTPWKSTTATFKVGKVPARQDAKVEEWIRWTEKGASYSTPWLARLGFGLGNVTWVAQDLGNPDLTTYANSDWRFVWDRVFGWNNANVPSVYQPPDRDDPWASAQGLDIGKPVLFGVMDLTNKALKLLAAAALFLVVYLIIAGPGSYAFLVMKKKAQLSWFVFGLSAIVATFVTVLLVKLLVRGPPELRHLSVVRLVNGQPDAVIDSRLGLYIPQDALKQMELEHNAPKQVSYIVPFGMPPQYMGDDDVAPAYQEYEIPVRDPSETDPVVVDIPYRSSSKKLQVHWIGAAAATIDVAQGSPIRLVPPRGAEGGYIAGTLLNHTGYDLTDIYLAFKHHGGISRLTKESTEADDRVWVVYVPFWQKQTPLKLDNLMANKNMINLGTTDRPIRPGGKDVAFGELGRDTRVATNFSLDVYWQGQGDHVNGGLDVALPMLSFFDLMQPWSVDPQNSRSTRFEIYRRTGRGLNLSAAVNAGELAICAVAEIGDDLTHTPLPISFKVSGDQIAGEGVTIFQCVTAIDRSAMYGIPAPVTTQPATQPAR